MAASSLKDALDHALKFWAARSGVRTMETRARACVEALGPTLDARKLTQTDGAKLLTKLAVERGLSRASQASYYAAFTRMLHLNGVPTHDWPKPATVPRKQRHLLSAEDIARVRSWLRERGMGDTAALTEALEATGLRIGIEALRADRLELRDGPQFATLTVRGKGGHERTIPIATASAGYQALSVICRAGSVRPYRTHLRRWHRALEACGLKGLATPHVLRHKYATEVLRGSGGNLRLVQELLGHSNPGTTARYAEISMEDKLEALNLRR